MPSSQRARLPPPPPTAAAALFCFCSCWGVLMRAEWLRGRRFDRSRVVHLLKHHSEAQKDSHYSAAQQRLDQAHGHEAAMQVMTQNATEYAKAKAEARADVRATEQQRVQNAAAAGPFRLARCVRGCMLYVSVCGVRVRVVGAGAGIGAGAGAGAGAGCWCWCWCLGLGVEGGLGRA